MRKYTKVINWADFPGIDCIGFKSTNIERTLCRCGHTSFESLGACPACGAKKHNSQKRSCVYDKKQKEFSYITERIRAEKHGEDLMLKKVESKEWGTEKIDRIYKTDTMVYIVTEPSMRQIGHIDYVLKMVQKYTKLVPEQCVAESENISMLRDCYNALYKIVDACHKENDFNYNINTLLSIVGPKMFSQKLETLQHIFYLQSQSVTLGSIVDFLREFKPSLIELYKETNIVNYSRIREVDVKQFNNIPDELLLYLVHLYKNGMLTENAVGNELNLFSTVEHWSDSLIECIKSYLKEMFGYGNSMFDDFFSIVKSGTAVHVKDFCLLNNLNEYKSNKKTYAIVEEMVESMSTKSPLQAFLEANVK